MDDDLERTQICLDIIQKMLDKGMSYKDIMKYLALSSGIAAEIETSTTGEDLETSLIQIMNGSLHNYRVLKESLDMPKFEMYKAPERIH